MFASKKLVGLDIGASSIKMAELDVGRQGAKVVSLGLIPAPASSFSNGDIQDAESIATAVRQVVHDHKVKRKQVSMGMAGTAVIVKKITIPRIDRKLLADQVRWEAEQYIPFDVNSIALAYHVINTPNAEMMDLLLVAAQNQVVGNYNQVVTLSGLDLNVLDVSGFALANIFEFNYGKLPGQCIGLLNIGATTTNFVVLVDGEVSFCRDMNVGGQNYTYEIHKELGVSLPEAEALKLSAIRGEGVPDEVHSILSSFNETITEEIRNSFDYFTGSSNNLSVNRCFVTGGGSGTPGLVENIAQATSVRMEYMNPFQRMSGSKTVSPQYFPQMMPFCSVVLGLALRKAGE